jgi:predicted pyridoxine 5'-phosphate oxidase superfamily flavin-nucleotide-binding protein
VYSNCPKYIQRREIVGLEAGGGEPASSAHLTQADRELIAAADTFFVATAAHGGADASHRGGSPGFVTVGDDRLTFPDYPGNNMYGTLGNLLANPRIGLLFLDWETGDTLQLTGSAELEFEPRAVHVAIERATRTPNAVPLRWVLLERSRFNP